MTPFNSLPTEKLAPEREQQLARLRTEEAAAELALYSTHQAIAYTRRCCRGALETDVLMSLCYDILLKIARRFEPGRQRFFAFAKAGLRGAIKDHWKTLDVVRNAKTISRAAAIFEQLDNKPPLIEEQEECHCFRRLDCLEEAMGGVVEPDFQAVHTAERWAFVAPILEAKCSELEKTVINLLYTGGFNYPEVGKMLDISRQAVQAVQSRALKKVRNELLRRKRLLNQD
jgi:RNA polymerase sigma factor (sigma-70 family)